MLILHHGRRSSASRRVRCASRRRASPTKAMSSTWLPWSITHRNIVKRIDEEIAPDEVGAQKHPRVSEWWSRLQARPAFALAKFDPFITTT